MIRYRLYRDGDWDIWLREDDEGRSLFTARCLGKAGPHLYDLVPAALWGHLEQLIVEQWEAEREGIFERAERRAEWNESRM